MKRPFPFFDNPKKLLRDNTVLSTGLTYREEKERARKLAGVNLSRDQIVRIHHNYQRYGCREGKEEAYEKVGTEEARQF